MLKKTIALLLCICIASVISGCAANPFGSNEYECDYYKFRISGSYSEKYPDGSPYIFSRNSGSTSVYISDTTIRCADMSVWLDYMVKRTAEDKFNNKTITSTDIVADLDCNYAAGAVHFKYDDGTGESNYYVENETKGLCVIANYDISDKDSVCRDMEELVRSVEYTSNFRLYTGYYEVKNDCFSVFVPKEWCYSTASFFDTGKKSVTFQKVRARTVEEMSTNVMIMTPEESDKSPKEVADENAENYENTVNGAHRFKSEVFGIEAECVEAEMIDPNVIVRVYYFEYDGLLYTVNLNYSTDDELADIEDLLDRIELK